MGVVSLTVIAALGAAGCAADRVALPDVTTDPAPTVGAVSCTGASARPLLSALFDDLGHGQPTPVATFFSAPKDFVRWVDPTTGPDITDVPGPGGPGSDAGTLDALQSHLDDLAAAGAAGTVTNFAIDGNPAGSSGDSSGGLFSFGLRARWSSNDPEADQGGFGMIDCASGKLKEVVILG